MREYAWVYILKCADNTLYTGYTVDIHRRLKEHNVGSKKCKYTAVTSRRPIVLNALWKVELPKKNAMSLECFIKSLSKRQKLLLINSPEDVLSWYRNKTNKYFDIQIEPLTEYTNIEEIIKC